MERHGDRWKDECAVGTQIGLLNQFATIQLVVVGHKEEIVWAAEIVHGALHRQAHMGGVAQTGCPNERVATKKETVDRCQHHTMVNGFEHIDRVILLVDDAHMVDSRPVKALRDLRNVVPFSRKTKQQVTLTKLSDTTITSRRTLGSEDAGNE